ncbi:MAG: FprA family A-type flavoprotein [Defluviitaleaceae bacterium]|nr:FprA family A-type flavoprotein [Defluviitaleaceae bacterium]
MKNPLLVRDGIYWVGALDFDIRVFDIIVAANHGTTYNSYLVKGKDKTVLVEAVKEGFYNEFMERLSQIADPSEIDYIVLNHTEPDHSGSLAKLVDACPKAEVLATNSGVMFAKKIANKDFRARAVKDGETLDIGGMTLRFIHAPLLHWPDTMFTYIEENKTIFTCDFLGCHYCDEQVFSDKVSGDFMGEFKYYFDNIMGPFKPNVLSALDKLKDLDIETVCNSHGPVIREGPKKYTELYRQWAAPVKNDAPCAVISYVSAYGYTKKLAEKIRDGLASEGVEARLFDFVTCDRDEAMAEINRADGLLFGSPTLVGEALPPIWDILSKLNPIIHKGKKAGAFGAYGWSGEAVPNIEGRLKQLKFAMPVPGLKVRFNPNDEELDSAFEFGKEFGKSLK